MCFYLQVSHSFSLLDYLASDAFIIVRSRLVLICRKMEELGNTVTVYVQLSVSLQFLEHRNPVAPFQSLVLLLKFAFMYNVLYFQCTCL